MPFLLVSPWARANYVSSTLLDQASVVKFIEDNWHLPAMGNGASDTAAGSIGLMFNFNGDPRRRDSGHGAGRHTLTLISLGCSQNRPSGAVRLSNARTSRSNSARRGPKRSGAA
jgi:phosphoesterase family protein